MSKVVNEREILYSCVSDNEDTEKSQEEIQEEMDYLEGDIYAHLGTIKNVSDNISADLSDNLNMWNIINDLSYAIEQLENDYREYEDLMIKLRG